MDQKALIVAQTGHPLKLISRPIPSPKPNEVRIKLTAVGLNPHDQKIRDTTFLVGPDRLPYVPANDIVGVVDQIGSDVKSVKPGSRVFAQANTTTNDGGGLQQYALIDAGLVGEVEPAAASWKDEELATLPTVVMAALVAVAHESGLGIPLLSGTDSQDLSHQTLLVVGGGSACGKLVIQLAKLAGFGKIVTTASKSTREKEEDLIRLGASVVIDRLSKTIKEDTRAAVGEDLIYAIDTFNGGDESQSFGVSMLSNNRKGTLVTLLPGTAAASLASEKKDGYNLKFCMGNGHLHQTLGRQAWKQLPKWVGDGVVAPFQYNVVDGLDVDKVNEALDMYRDGTGSTKTIVRLV